MRAVRTAAGGPVEPWGDGCSAWPLVDHADMSIKEELMPPCTVEQAHRHRRARQFFYVLAGTGCMRLPDGDITLGPGEGVEIAPGAVHQMRNDSTETLRLLAISTPHTRDDREEVELS